MLAYSIIFTIIKAYSGILIHYSVILRLIQTYSAPCVTLTDSQPCHILSPGIYRTRGLFKTLWNVDQAHTIASRRIFKTLWHLQKFTNIQNSDIFKIQDIFRTLYFFCKIVKNYNYFSKVLHLRSLTRFWISLNRYSLTGRVTSHYVLYDTY